MAKYYKQRAKTALEQTRAKSDFERALLGQRINRENYLSDNAWTVPAYYAAVKEIASAVDRTDLWVKKIRPDGGKEHDKNHPAYWLLSHKANPFTNSLDWLKTTIANAIVYGNSYSRIKRYNVGNAIALHNLDSTCMEVVPTYDDDGVLASLSYEYTINGKTKAFAPDDVFHLKDLPIDTGIQGIDATEMMKQTLKKANAIQQFQCLYFSQGSHIGHIAKIPGWLTDEQKADMKENLENLSGIANSHKLAIFQGGSDVESMSVNAQDMELSAVAESTLTDISNGSSIPGTRIGARGSISYGSLEQDNLLFAQSLDNWLTAFEAEATTKLLRAREQGETHVIEFDRGSFLASDPSYQDLQMRKYDKGIITLAEVREKLGEYGDFSELLEPEPAPVQAEPIAEPTPAEPVETRGRQLTENILLRLKTRLIRAVESGKTDLSKHHNIIKEQLRGLNCEPVITQLYSMQAEIDAVLPEQRAMVIKKWNTPQTASKIWS